MGAAVSVLITLEDMGACYSCGTRFAAEARFKQNRLRDHGTFYCPNGHAQSYCGETEAERLKKELDAEKLARERAESLARQRGVEVGNLQRTKKQVLGKLRAVKQRVAHGICPCCKRTFVQLQRHIATKHPSWLEEQEKARREAAQGGVAWPDDKTEGT